MPRMKCLLSGAPACSRLGDREDAESRFKIGAPNPKVCCNPSESRIFTKIFTTDYTDCTDVDG